MPEGDTIYKVARILAPCLESRRIANIELADNAAARVLRSRRINRVTARGKHLFIEIDNGTSLRSHLGMHGSWHRYEKTASWRKPRGRASIVLEVDGTHFVCFDAKEVEVVSNDSVRSRILAARTGPDLIADAADDDSGIDVQPIVRRARDFIEADAPIIDVLLDQRVASGIGNVYKSEVLFVERLLPTTRLGATDDAVLGACYARASELLRKNLRRWPAGYSVR